MFWHGKSCTQLVEDKLFHSCFLFLVIPSFIHFSRGANEFETPLILHTPQPPGHRTVGLLVKYTR